MKFKRNSDAAIFLCLYYVILSINSWALVRFMHRDLSLVKVDEHIGSISLVISYKYAACSTEIYFMVN